MTGLTFHKMSGSGNDFVVLDGRHSAPADWSAERIRWLCDRRLGVGADGMVILTVEAPGHVRMDFWNCDGSRAAMCGNAALCSTRLSVLLGLAPAEGMLLVTRAGTFPTRCVAGPGEEAELNLPDIGVPVAPSGLQLEAGESVAFFAAVGVPHLVLEVSDLDRLGLMDRGRDLRSHKALGPDGANVNFVAPSLDSRGAAWRIRTYERGVEGETLACGTGAVAAAIALASAGRANLPLTLMTRSGLSLRIKATLSGGTASDIWLRGEGRLVFKGVL